MLSYIDGLQLSWIWGEVGRLMKVDRRWLASIGDQKDRAVPEAELEVHVRVTQIRTEIDSVGCRHLVEVNTARRWRPCERCRV